jgi:tRNA threonylcarbamoyladenosine biosynthesis protein TsaB
MNAMLAIETSTPMGSIAIGSADGIRAEAMIGERTRHAEALLPTIDFLLERSGFARADIDAVAVGSGPGSFTGVRIAAAAAKAWAHARRIPLFARSSLAVVAAGCARPGGVVCALFDARRDEVYAGCWRFDDSGSIDTVLDPRVEPLADVIDRLRNVRPLWIGNGAHRHTDRIREAGGVIGPAHLSIPRAAALIWLVSRDPAAARVERPARFEPVYLRASGAERGVTG